MSERTSDDLTVATVLVRLRGQCFQLDRGEAERLHDDLGALLGRPMPSPYFPFVPVPYPAPADTFPPAPLWPPWPIVTCRTNADSAQVASQTVCRSEDGVRP